MYDLPEAIELGGAPFAIRNRGDFRMVLDCFKALNDDEITEQERLYACLMIFYADMEELQDIAKLPDLEEATRKMFEFFNCGCELYDTKSNPKLIDWEKDSMLVCSAVNTVAKMEVRSQPYLHWWTFMGYYMGIGECALSTIVSIRYKIAKNQKLEKHEKKFRDENPNYFSWDFRTAAQKQADEYIQNLWNGGGK